MTRHLVSPKRVVIIGGVLARLAAAYDLVRVCHHVTILEGAPDFGGLASSFRLEGMPVERFYHFICRTDSSEKRAARVSSSTSRWISGMSSPSRRGCSTPWSATGWVSASPGRGSRLLRI